MKQIFVLLSFYYFIVSCAKGKSFSSSLSYPFTANILTMSPMGSAQNRFESPRYVIDDVMFDSLYDLEHLDGAYFKLYRGGSIQENKDSFLIEGSRNPKLNYKIIDGVVVAKDYATLAMLSAYYQFDFIASRLVEISNIHIQDIVNTYGKIEVFFEPKFSQESGGIVLMEFPKQNAAYLPYFHKFILFSRSNSEHVPLSMNLQVIAHEFGHSLWEYVFNEGEAQLCDRMNAEYVIHGLNEGFADFFSYTVTGSTNILFNSLNHQSLADMRNFSIIKFKYRQISDPYDLLSRVCENNYYCIGTLFANSLFKTQKILGYDQTAMLGNKSRSEFFKKIVSALINTRENMKKYLPPMPQNFDICASGVFVSDGYNRAILNVFFVSFLKQIDDIEIKSTLELMLMENFGN